MKRLYQTVLPCLLLLFPYFLQSQDCTAFAGDDVTICGFDCIQLQATGGDEYLWTPAEGLSDPTIANPVACVGVTTNYTVQITVTATSCTTTDMVTITSVSEPVADAGLAQPLSPDSPTVTLDGTFSTPDATYMWVASEGGNIVSGGTTLQPVVDAAGVYTLTVTIGDCSDTDATVVYMDEGIEIFCMDDATYSCEQIPDAIRPQIINHCDSEVSFNLIEEVVPGDCANSYTLYRRWIVYNGCEEEAECVQTITVVDDVAPEFLFFQNPTVISCEEYEAGVSDGALQAVDNCSAEVLLDYIDLETVSDCDNTFTITREWHALDECGNEKVVVQTLQVVDNVAPLFTFVPESFEVDCAAANETTLVFGMPQYIDNCGEVMLTEVMETVTGECAYNYQIIKTWTATDACGNAASASQTITVSDVEAPVFVDTPTEIMLECGDTDEVIFPNAMDDCGEVQFTYVDTPFENDPSCEIRRTMLRTWTAWDDCSNSSEFLQYLIYVDNTPPVFTEVPADKTVNCDFIVDDVSPENLVSTMDNCGLETDVTYSEMVVPSDCDGNYQLIRTWVATDDCGNSAEASQTITFEDTTPPFIFNVPNDITINCGEIIPAEEFEIFAIDDCNEATVTVEYNEEELPAECPNLLIIKQTWTAHDGCGNMTVASRMVEVVDDIAPVFYNLLDTLSLECSEYRLLAEANELGMPDVEDACGTVAVDYSEIVEGDDCTFTVFRIWTATDECGNSESYEHVVHVMDETAPVFADLDLPLLELECDMLYPDPFIPVVTDNCDTDPSVFFEENIITETPCYKAVTRTWTAIDNCNNESFITQELRVYDSTAPEFVTVPMDITVECDAIPDPAVVQAIDNCNNMDDVIFEQSTVGGDCAGNYTIFRTWTVADACGNENAHQQTITVEDNTPPVLIGVPADMTVDCENIPATTFVDAMDNCTIGLEVSFIEQMSGACPDNHSIIRTWTVEDDCGNVARQVQVITVQQTPVECTDIFVEAEISVNAATAPVEVCLPVQYTLNDYILIVDGEMVELSDHCLATDAPDGIQAAFDYGAHEVIVIDENGCQDRMMVMINPQCGEFVTEGVTLNSRCDEDVLFCTGLSIVDIENCYINVDGERYEDLISICAGTTGDVQIVLPVGAHYVEFIDRTTTCVKHAFDVGVVSEDTACDILEIDLSRRWNMISSNVVPTDVSFENIFNELGNDLVLVKNDQGENYIPRFNINEIVDWDVTEGYRLKMQRENLLTIRGTKVDPTQVPIDLEIGWQIIAYLRDSPASVLSELSSVNNNIVIIKDDEGNVTIPSFNINNIGDFFTGKGYKVKAISPATFYYSANDETGSLEADIRNEPASLQYFTQHLEPTGTDATWVFPQQALSADFEEGDEIAVFNPAGLLCGAAVYENAHFALTVWGDDETTEVVEGLKIGETAIFKRWNKATGAVETVDVQLAEGTSSYQKDAYNVVSNAKVKGNALVNVLAQPLLLVTPNPTPGTISVDIDFPQTTAVNIQIYDMNGQLIQAPLQYPSTQGLFHQKIHLGQVADGVYLLQLKTEHLVINRRIVVSR